MNYKDKDDFETDKKFYEYLSGLSTCGNSPELIANRMRRIGAGYTVETATNTPRVVKSDKTHPYRNGSYLLNAKSRPY